MKKEEKTPLHFVGTENTESLKSQYDINNNKNNNNGAGEREVVVVVMGHRHLK